MFKWGHQNVGASTLQQEAGSSSTHTHTVNPAPTWTGKIRNSTARIELVLAVGLLSLCYCATKRWVAVWKNVEEVCWCEISNLFFVTPSKFLHRSQSSLSCLFNKLSFQRNADLGNDLRIVSSSKHGECGAKNINLESFRLGSHYVYVTASCLVCNVWDRGGLLVSDLSYSEAKYHVRL